MTESMRFTKGHGTENDFVLLDDPEGELDLDPATVAALCDRRSGVGADGVIRAVRTQRAGIDAPGDAPEWFMDYRNADGSTAEMCGNGVRVLAAHLQRAAHVQEDRFEIWTRSGLRTIEILAHPDAGSPSWSVRVGMGPSRIGEDSRTVEIAGRALAATDVDMGNPHAVAFLPAELALDELDLSRRPVLDPEPADGANIELVSERGERHVAMRVFERGVGETRSCGTGVAAVAVAAALRAGDGSRQPWRVDVPGGTLQVGWTGVGEVTLTGPAVLVADGVTLI
ncbi:diaminopimelate epimerase [Brachybacterium sp. GCM10030267]|uniref:diaminopimelate epimerase n=1 Tax=unclassified Brachybacterium TaxID=2623841 RepID=UPI003623AABA